jgi:hypothetical protein
MKAAVAATIAAIASANSIPIFGRWPGFVQGGNKLDITV